MALSSVRGFPASQVEAQQDTMGLRHVADESPQGKRQFLDQSRGGDDLFALRQSWVLGNIHDFQFIATVEVLLADFANIHDRLG